MKVSTMKAHLRRYLYRARLFLKVVVEGLKAARVRTPPDPPLPVSPGPGSDGSDGGEAHPGRFFFVVVEVPEEDKELIRLMQVNPSVAAAIQLPDGCQFRTCFEISAEYAKVIINM